MTHLEDGTLQAFLDDELEPGERAEVAEHLLGCTRCHESYGELVQANALFSRSVPALDVAPPSQAVGSALGRRARVGTSAFVKAAGLVLALAAVASAAVPGSPVREWIERAVEPEAPAAEAPAARMGQPEAHAAAAPAGLSLASAGDRLVVAVTGLQDATIRLEGVEGERATVAAVDFERDPSFSTRAGRAEVRNGVGGVIRVGLPVSVDGARLESDGRPLAEVRKGVLVPLVPADTVDGALVWR